MSTSISKTSSGHASQDPQQATPKPNPRSPNHAQKSTPVPPDKTTLKSGAQKNGGNSDHDSDQG